MSVIGKRRVTVSEQKQSALLADIKSDRRLKRRVLCLGARAYSTPDQIGKADGTLRWYFDQLPDDEEADQ